ncbi:MAG: hypothetical protein K0Q66_689 [Chitinophagaceae bacterium]|jgi:hypothetical protein|nr:hypothetical protein [Chitinophagaceae bacterium]
MGAGLILKVDATDGTDRWSAGKNNMLRLVMILSCIAFLGCDKNTLENRCARLKDGITANDMGKVEPVVSYEISRLSSRTYNQANLQALANALGNCSVTTQLCFDCIKTLPSQSEIIVSYSPDGIIVIRKVIDISYDAGNTMRFHNMHD